MIDTENMDLEERKDLLYDIREGKVKYKDVIWECLNENNSVHAHWKNVKRVLNTEWGECSNCDRAHELTRYCPYCGAKMDEEEEEL